MLGMAYEYRGRGGVHAPAPCNDTEPFFGWCCCSKPQVDELVTTQAAAQSMAEELRARNNKHISDTVAALESKVNRTSLYFPIP